MPEKPDLAELRRLQDRRLSKPWKAELGWCGSIKKLHLVVPENDGVHLYDDDATRLIVAAVNALPWLIAAAKRADKYEAALRNCVKEWDDFARGTKAENNPPDVIADAKFALEATNEQA